jgi:hypothetical protein
MAGIFLLLETLTAERNVHHPTNRRRLLPFCFVRRATRIIRTVQAALFYEGSTECCIARLVEELVGADRASPTIENA